MVTIGYHSHFSNNKDHSRGSVSAGACIYMFRSRARAYVYICSDHGRGRMYIYVLITGAGACIYMFRSRARALVCGRCGLLGVCGAGLRACAAGSRVRAVRGLVCVPVCGLYHRQRARPRIYRYWCWPGRMRSCAAGSRVRASVLSLPQAARPPPYICIYVLVLAGCGGICCKCPWACWRPCMAPYSSCKQS